jgi:hypothetical protein
MTAGQTIDYEALAQDAMRGLVRTVLQRAAKTGLPGDHHFYISFDTEAAGVSLSKRLKEKYPREMTIVLQHRFWDLLVNDERFEVKLTFDGIPERLVVPFQSIKVFFDPSVRYGLQFEDPHMGPDADLSALGLRGEPRPRPAVVRKPRATRPAKGRPERDGAEPATPSPAPLQPVLARGPSQHPAASPGNANGNGKAREAAEGSAAAPVEAPAPAETPAAPAGAQIVSLDQFRKK